LIFVITGMHEHPFDRLVQAVDEYVRDGVFEDAYIQTGYSNYKPQHCPWSKAIDFEEFERIMERADIIITHGGAGSIAGALERNKPTIAVPRLKRYGEHNNDHQLELVSVLEKAGRILVVQDMLELPSVVSKAKHFKPAPAAGQSRVVEVIREYLKRC
jgi:UDP-N-acetylglucosamine transferase subunit ALG13